MAEIVNIARKKDFSLTNLEDNNSNLKILCA